MINNKKENTNKEEVNSREQKILDAAKEVFARKGYDAARVEEIAKEAGVNKALLFYYFRSKENILKQLIERGIVKAVKILNEHINGILENDEEAINTLIEDFIGFLFARKKLIKIMLLETFKDDNENTYIMDFINPLLEALKESREDCRDLKDEIDYKLRMFFINTAPIITYIVIGDKWSDYYKLDQAESEKRFIKMIKEQQSYFLLTHKEPSIK